MGRAKAGKPLVKSLQCVQSASDLIQVLKATFNPSKSKKPREDADEYGFPLNVGDDAVHVVMGSKTVLEGTSLRSLSGSPFNFSCTACGACCKSLSSTVLLDAFDCYTLAHAVPSGGSIAQLVAQGKLVQKLGLFSRHALANPAMLAHAPASQGIAPVLFLASQRAPSFSFYLRFLRIGMWVLL
jgi:hypothetical protein